MVTQICRGSLGFIISVCRLTRHHVTWCAVSLLSVEMCFHIIIIKIIIIIVFFIDGWEYLDAFHNKIHRYTIADSTLN